MKQAGSLKTSSGEAVARHRGCCLVLFDRGSKTSPVAAGFVVEVLS